MIKRLFFILVVVPLSLFSQGYEMIHYDVKNGLLDNNVWALEQDSLGRMLAFSQLGINIFEGNEINSTFFPIGYNPDYGSKLYIDSKNNVSVQEYSGYIEYKQNKFSVLKFPEMYFWVADGNIMWREKIFYKDKFGNNYFKSTFLTYTTNGKTKYVDTNIFRGQNYQLFDDNRDNIYAYSSDKIYFLENGKIISVVPIDLAGISVGLTYLDNSNLYFTTKIHDSLRLVYELNTKNNSLQLRGSVKNTPLKFLKFSNQVFLLTPSELLEIKSEKGNLQTVYSFKDHKAISGIFNYQGEFCYVDKNAFYQVDLSIGRVIQKIDFPYELFNVEMKLDSEGNIWRSSENGVFLFRKSIWNTFARKSVDEKNVPVWFEPEGENFFFKNKKYLVNSTAHDSIELSVGSNDHVCFPYKLSFFDKPLFLSMDSPKNEFLASFSDFYYYEGRFNKAIQNLKVTYLKAYSNKKDSLSKNSIRINFDKDFKTYFSDRSFVYYKGKEFSVNSIGPFYITNQRNVSQFVVRNFYESNESDNRVNIESYNNNHFQRIYKYKNKLYYNDLPDLYTYNETKDTFRLLFKLEERIRALKLANDGYQIPIFPVSDSKFIYFDTLGQSINSYFLKEVELNGKINFIAWSELADFNSIVIQNAYIFKDIIYIHSNSGLLKLRYSNKKYELSYCETSIHGIPEEVFYSDDYLVAMYNSGLQLIDSTGISTDYFFAKNWIGKMDLYFFSNWRLVYFDKHKRFNFFTDKFWVRLNVKSKSEQHKLWPVYLKHVSTIGTNGKLIHIEPDSLTNSLYKIDYKVPLEIDFGFSSFASADSVKYKIKLEGLDEDFYIQKEHKVKYSRLFPGKYKLIVYAYGGNGIWTKNPMEITIEIKAPFYLTKLAFVIYLMLVIGFLILFIRLNNRRLRQNALQLKHQVDLATNEISKQKELIEEKQKEIVDSINYAKRIQLTLLAHDEFLKKNLYDYFSYFNPKDIVSGDFYWATSTGSGLNKKFYLAVCDSTGHGVPGAFMSLLNIGFLNEAINEKGISQPNEIFNYVRKKLTETISKEGQKDGFDGILLCFESDKKRITYAAANNPPVLIHNQSMIECGADRMPVGVGEKHDEFTLYTLEYSFGDMLYLYTDGYPDQFGGPKGKKFKYKALNQLLIELSVLPSDVQAEQIKNVFNSWKGNLEQVDDVCVFGIKLNSF